MRRFEPILQRTSPWIIPYVTAGYPNPGETVGLLRALEQGGADAIELGLPFSDPLADGPVIQASSQTALEAGISHRRILDMVREFREGSSLPVILMGYLNPILHYGPDRFFVDAAQAGADGLIVPDLPVEEAGPYLQPARDAGLAWTFLGAPTSSSKRLRQVDEASDLWSYCVSVAGVTGARKELPQGLSRYLGAMAKVARKPFVVGFGISRPEHVSQVCPPARGVVIGSALIRHLSEEPTAETRRARAESYVRSMRAS